MLNELTELETAFAVAVFSSKVAFRLLRTYDFSNPEVIHTFRKDLEQAIYNELRSLYPFLPDHHYESLIKFYFSTKLYSNQIDQVDSYYSSNSLIQLIHNIFSYLTSSFIINVNGSLYIDENRFLEWQYLMTTFLTTPIIAFYFCSNKYDFNSISYILEDKYSFVLYPYYHNLKDLFIDDFFDLHVHLNGILEAEIIVHYLIENPHTFLREIRSLRCSEDQFYDFFKQFDIEFTPYTFFKILLLAKYLRRELVLSFTKQYNVRNLSEKFEQLSALFKIYHFNYGNIIDSITKLDYCYHPFEHVLSYNSIFFSSVFSVIKKGNILSLEALFLFSLFRRLNEMSFYELIIFYSYLLLSNIIKRFLVLQLDQFGLEQFIKLFSAGPREYPEKNYDLKFLQLNTFYEPSLSYLEGRIAPANGAKEFIKKTKKIIVSYEKLRKGHKIKFGLGLIVHFIKKKEREKSIFIRHHRLRIELKKKAQALIQAIRLFPKLRQYIVGIDAASNELFAPPEVFAPTFCYIKREFNREVNKYCKREIDIIFYDHRLLFTEKFASNLSLVSWEFENNYDKGSIKIDKRLPQTLKVTFHVGEDFNHLLSGLRAIYEAIVFLPLEPGDRLGHATALGIDPYLWLKRVPNHILIKKGEWLDNLIFAYHILDDYKLKISLEKEIMRYFFEIYNVDNLRNKINIHDIVTSYHCRCVDPLQFDFFEGNLSIDCISSVCNIGMTVSDMHLYLLKLYHYQSFRKRYDEYIKIDKNDKLINSNVLKDIQLKLSKMINSRQIGIEVMVSSNVKISYYKNFEEHHIFRWLNDKDLNSNIVICSDDPGVFHTNVQNEYMIIATVLLKNEGIEYVRSCLSKLKEQARRWAFKFQ